ncbi:MAG: thiamine diphosphokinase [Litoreibacter sp.]
MIAAIVHSDTFLTLLGAGPTQVAFINQLPRDGMIRVAADGGAVGWMKAGIVPDVVIGDMDSLDPIILAQIPKDRLHHIPEQDSTDFEKCLRRIEAPLILAAGFMGGRLDHELAACTALVRYPDQRCILIGDEDICFLAPNAFEIDLPVGTRFSLFPMGPVRGTSQGLKYSIDGLTLAPNGRVGTSNEVDGPVSLTFETREMLIILPRELLRNVACRLAPDLGGPEIPL